MSFRSKEVRRHVRQEFTQSAPSALGQVPNRLHAITSAQVQGEHLVRGCPVSQDCELAGSCDGDVCLFNELLERSRPN